MRPTALALFPQLPFPLFSGDRQKVNRLIILLSKHFSLHILIICRTLPKEEDILFLKKHSVSYQIFKLNTFKSIFNVIKSFILGKSIQAGFFYNRKIQKAVNQMVNEVDFIFCNAIRTSSYVENIEKIKFLDMVDTQSAHYERAIKKSVSFFWRILYTQEAKRLKRYEVNVLDKFNYIYLVNKYEINRLKTISATDNILYTPNGIKEELFTYKKIDAGLYQSKSICFIGKMDYQPNIDAVVWFMENVFEYLATDIKFYILGANPTSKIKSYSNDRVKVCGYLDDPYLILNSCKIVVSPMQTGGGVQNKILEGMALAKINITTSLGIEGIAEAENNKDVIIIDDPKEMSSIINNIIDKFETFEYIGKNAKELVENKYSWELFEQVIVNSIKQTINQN